MKPYLPNTSSKSTNQNIIQISNLHFGTKYGTGFLVPGNGWYIFGGNAFQKSTPIQVQSLTSVGSFWAFNTLNYSSDPSYGRCSVQVRGHSNNT